MTEILNRHERFSKAQYIVDAVMHYERCNNKTDNQCTPPIDERVFEATVSRLFRNIEVRGIDQSDGSAHLRRFNHFPLTTEEADISTVFDVSIDALGEDEFDIVSGALDMFRSK